MAKNKAAKKAKTTRKKSITTLPAKRPKNTDSKLVIAYRIMGLSHQEIAERVGVSRPAITQLLTRLEFSQTELKNFRENRADYLTWDQLRYRKHITESKLKKTAPEKLKKMEKDCFEMERTELGKQGQTGTILFADLLQNVTNIQIKHDFPAMEDSLSTHCLPQAGINGLGVPVNQEGHSLTPDLSVEIVDGEEIFW